MNKVVVHILMSSPLLPLHCPMYINICPFFCGRHNGIGRAGVLSVHWCVTRGPMSLLVNRGEVTGAIDR